MVQAHIFPACSLPNEDVEGHYVARQSFQGVHQGSLEDWPFQSHHTSKMGQQSGPTHPACKNPCTACSLGVWHVQQLSAIVQWQTGPLMPLHCKQQRPDRRNRLCQQVRQPSQLSRG